MKIAKYTLFYYAFVFSLFTFSLSFAQMTVKDGDDNILLQVNDYGTKGTVTLPPFTEILPTLPINNQMLYNFDGNLYFNGSALGTSNNAGGWTRPITGGKIYPTDLTDKVGIGTNNPQSDLSIGGDGFFGTPIFSVSDYFSAAGIDARATATGNTLNFGGVFQASGNSGRGVDGRALAYGDVENYGGHFTTNGQRGRGVYAKALGINAYGGYFEGRGYFSGNVGIGTENPSSKLSVGGDGLSSASISAYSSLPTGIGVYSEATASNAYAGYFDGRGYFTGNVGIGQSSPALRLHVQDDVPDNFVAKIENTSIGTDGDGLAILINVGVPASSNHFIRFQRSGGVNIGNITGNGNSVNFNTTSDARLKTKFETYSNALEIVSQIGIKKYERIANPGTEEIGVIAQELQKVYPQSVSGSPNSDVKTDPMMVDYSKLTPLLVKGMQEQQELIKTQDFRIKELEEKLSKLESLFDVKRFTHKK